MKQLVVLRHAKTEAEAVDDWHRSLTDRGREQARSVGPILAGLGLTRPVVHVSTALRAKQTWEEIAPALEPDLAIRPNGELYAVDETALLEVLRETDEDADQVLLVAHNPGVSTLAWALSGRELPNDRTVAKYGSLRTCRGAALHYDGAWSDLGARDCSLAQYVVPAVD